MKVGHQFEHDHKRSVKEKGVPDQFRSINLPDLRDCLLLEE